MSEELKSCPFCGNKNIQLFLDDVNFAMLCTKCMAEGPICETEQEAIDAWNRRK